MVRDAVISPVQLGRQGGPWGLPGSCPSLPPHRNVPRKSQEQLVLPVGLVGPHVEREQRRRVSVPLGKEVGSHLCLLCKGGGQCCGAQIGDGETSQGIPAGAGGGASSRPLCTPHGMKVNFARALLLHCQSSCLQGWPKPHRLPIKLIPPQMEKIPLQGYFNLPGGFRTGLELRCGLLPH